MGWSLVVKLAVPFWFHYRSACHNCPADPQTVDLAGFKGRWWERCGGGGGEVIGTLHRPIW